MIYLNVHSEYYQHSLYQSQNQLLGQASPSNRASSLTSEYILGNSTSHN